MGDGGLAVSGGVVVELTGADVRAVVKAVTSSVRRTVSRTDNLRRYMFADMSQ